MPAKLQRGQVRTHKLDLGDGDSVVLKDKFTNRDRSVINNAAVSGKITTTGGEEVVLGTLNIGAAPLQTLVVGVLDWDGPSFCQTDHYPDGSDKPKVDKDHTHTRLPLTPENLDMMFDEYSGRILKDLNDRNPRAVAQGNPTKDGGQKS